MEYGTNEKIRMMVRLVYGTRIIEHFLFVTSTFTDLSYAFNIKALDMAQPFFWTVLKVKIHWFYAIILWYSKFIQKDIDFPIIS